MGPVGVIEVDAYYGEVRYSDELLVGIEANAERLMTQVTTKP
jgi:hypothetical protein